MTFEQARDKLKRLANGRYYCIQYGLVEFASGGVEAKCHLYIDPRISINAPNWTNALAQIEMKLNLQLKVDPSEFPGEELKGEENKP